MTRPGTLLARIGSHIHLAKGSGSFVITMLLQAGSSFVFWAVAAHIVAPGQLGVATGLVASVTFITYLTSLGIPLTLARVASDDSPASRRIVGAGLVITMVTSAAVAVGYVVVLSSRATEGGAGPSANLLFVLIATCVSVSSIVDSRLVSIRRRRAVVWKVVVVAAARMVLILLALVIEPRGIGLFAMLLAPDAVTGIVAAIVLTRGARWTSFRGVLGGVDGRSVLSMSFVAFIGQLGLQAPVYVIPMIGLWLLGADDYGPFYVAWAAANLAMFIPQATMWSFHIEAGRDSAEFAGQVRFARAISIAGTAVATVLSIGAVPIVILIFGSDFTDAMKVLPWFVLGTVPWSVVVITTAEIRLVGRSRTALMVAVLDGFFAVVPTMFMGRAFGLIGVATGWCFGALLAAIALLSIRSIAHLDHTRVA